MPALGTVKCTEICRHCFYEEIYVDVVTRRGDTPLSYDAWLRSIWLPHVARVLATP